MLRQSHSFQVFKPSWIISMLLFWVSSMSVAVAEYGGGYYGSGMQVGQISKMQFPSEQARKQYFVQMIASNAISAQDNQWEKVKQSMINDLNSTNYSPQEKAQILKAASEYLAGAASYQNMGSKIYEKLPSLAMVQSSENYNLPLLKKLEENRKIPGEGLLANFDQLTSLGRLNLYIEGLFYLSSGDSEHLSRMKKLEEKMQKGSSAEKDFVTNLDMMKALNKKSGDPISSDLMDRFAESIPHDARSICILNSPMLWDNFEDGGLSGVETSKYSSRWESKRNNYAKNVVHTLKALKSKNISMNQECLRSPSDLLGSLEKLGYGKEVAELRSSLPAKKNSEKGSFDELLSSYKGTCNVSEFQSQIAKMSKTAAQSKVIQLVSIQQQAGCGITGLIQSDKVDLTLKINGADVLHFVGKNQQAELLQLANQMKNLSPSAKTEANLVLPGFSGSRSSSNIPLERKQNAPKEGLRPVFYQVFGAK